MNQITIDGESLRIEDVVAVARGFQPIALNSDATARLARSRLEIERVAAGSEAVYGVNTGFGKLASVKVSPDQLATLQRNLILSHASGLGDPLPTDIVRAAMLLRINVLVHDVTGVRPVVPETLAAMLNAGIHPLVPEQGSVGASGDLAPLSHIALGLIGEGDVDVISDHEGRAQRSTASDALVANGITPVVLGPKEGLALINGTQVQTAVLALAVADANRLWRNVHAVAAMTLETLKGSPTPFDSRIHAVRAHPGQIESAALMRFLLPESGIRDSHREDDPRVQDPYSLRCIPQVYGAVKDTIDFATTVATKELNAVTDNPILVDGEVLSGGNFHGQPIAMALDYLTIALTTLAGLAERRLERVLNPNLSPGLPAFLAASPGLESGLMMVQIAAAALVGESRTFSNPACVHSIPTDANQEDYVPMGMAAAMKARRVLENARKVVACELLCAAQGLPHHRPLRSSPLVEALHERVRAIVPPLEGDRPLSKDIERLDSLLREESLV